MDDPLSEDSIRRALEALWENGHAMPDPEPLDYPQTLTDRAEARTIETYMKLRKAFWPCWGYHAFEEDCKHEPE